MHLPFGRGPTALAGRQDLAAAAVAPAPLAGRPVAAAEPAESPSTAPPLRPWPAVAPATALVSAAAWRCAFACPAPRSLEPSSISLPIGRPSCGVGRYT